MIIPSPEKAEIAWLVHFGLSGPIFACLKQTRMKTIADLQIHPDSQLMSLRGFEQFYLRNIKLSLKAYNEAWREQEN